MSTEPKDPAFEPMREFCREAQRAFGPGVKISVVPRRNSAPAPPFNPEPKDKTHG